MAVLFDLSLSADNVGHHFGDRRPQLCRLALSAPMTYSPTCWPAKSSVESRHVKR